MAKSLYSYEFLEDILQGENIIDYESDNVTPVVEDPESDTSVSRKPSRIAPNPFPQRSTAHALTTLRASTTLDEPIITNKLDEKQQHFINENERARHLSQTLVMPKRIRNIASSL